MLGTQSQAILVARSVPIETRDLKRAELVPALLSISKSMRALRGIKLATLGFNNGQDELLMAVPDGGLPVAQLADLLMIRPSTVSKMTDRLIEKGLVERVGDLRDARRTIVRITPAGIEARGMVIAARQELEEELTKTIDEDSLTSRQACLGECAEMLERRLKRLR
jgi:DNA-binding MarR family transcriptional regulator